MAFQAKRGRGKGDLQEVWNIPVIFHIFLFVPFPLQMLVRGLVKWIRYLSENLMEVFTSVQLVTLPSPDTE